MGLATLKCHKIPIFLISRCHALWPPRASMLPRSAWTGGLSMISWGFTWDFQQQFHGDLHGIFNSNFMWFTWDFQQQFHGKFMGLTTTIADSTSRHWDFSMGFQWIESCKSSHDLQTSWVVDWYLSWIYCSIYEYITLCIYVIYIYMLYMYMMEYE